MPDVLLARYADCIFWLARYVERAENLARILDVNETFSRDSRGGQNWRSIVQLNSDEERFFKTRPTASAHSVVSFYVIDAGNPTSIVSTIRYARENARSLRPLISTEMWVQLNVFYNRLAGLGAVDLAPGNLAALFATIKEACQTPHRHHRGYLLPRPGLVLLSARPLYRARRPDDASPRHQISPPAAQRFRCRFADRCQPVERPAPLGGRLPCLPAPPRGQHDPGASGGVPVAEPGFPALGPSLRPRGRPIAGRGQVAACATWR